ncbi:MAG: ABC transporter permease [Chloroflexota bacterium]
MKSQQTTVPAPAPVEERSAAPKGLRLYMSALWQDKIVLVAAIFVLIVLASAVLANVVAPYDPYEQVLRLRNKPPMTPSIVEGGFPYVLGTDPLGRDMLTRLIYGSRISLVVGFASVVVSGSFGVLMGLLAGYYRKWVDDLIMRVVDLQMGFPSLMLALFVLYALGPGFWNVVVVLALTRWMVYARVTRSMMLTLRESAFVEAARCIGAGDRRIIFRHMLPNLLSPILVLATLEMATMILTEASLDFLGLGIQPPETSWGLMLAQGKEYITSAWWLVTFPGVIILMATLGFNLIATWVRAVTDPVQAWRWLGKVNLKA